MSIFSLIRLVLIPFLLTSITGFAQNYPTKPITLVAPFAPGGNVDIVARALAQSLSQTLGQPVTVENRAGAGGAIGSSYVSHAESDGYTLLVATTNTISVLPYMLKNPPYQPNQFQPIGLAAVSPLIVVVRADDKRFPNAASLIAAAKKTPGSISAGHPGLGTSNNIAILRIEDIAKINFNVIPYKGSAPALTDLIGGQLDFMIDQISSSKPFIDSGKLRVIGVLSKDRDPSIPTVPSFQEATNIEIQANTSSGLLAPPKTPTTVVNMLNSALVKAVQDPAYRARLTSVGSTPKTSSVLAWTEALEQESRNSEALSQDGKLKAE